MAAKIDIVIQHALRTFARHYKKIPECLQKEINELKSLTDDLTAKDINNFGGLSKTSEFQEFLQKKKTALDYLAVYEDEEISVGVFLLKEGAKLPIHDHPNMYGLIKVLEGILKITSYSVIDIDKTLTTNNKSMFYNHPLRVIKHPEILVGNTDRSCLLTPTEKNIHEVECVVGPAAFLDILSPPYQDGGSELPRVCHFFKEASQEGEDDEVTEQELKLMQVPSPF